MGLRVLKEERVQGFKEFEVEKKEMDMGSVVIRDQAVCACVCVCVCVCRWVINWPHKDLCDVRTVWYLDCGNGYMNIHT